MPRPQHEVRFQTLGRLGEIRRLILWPGNCQVVEEARPGRRLPTSTPIERGGDALLPRARHHILKTRTRRARPAKCRSRAVDSAFGPPGCFPVSNTQPGQGV
jgi:hypothetical protein